MNAALDLLEAEARRQPPPVQGIQPHLVFRVPVAAGTSPTELTDRLQQLGIAVVSIENDGAVIAFRGDTDLSEFKEAVRKYQRGPAINQKTGLRYKSTRYDVFEIIEVDQMRRWGRTDRVGRRLANAIGKNGESIDSATLYVLDVDLWHRGTTALAKVSVTEVQKLVQDGTKAGEKFSDTFIGDVLCLARITVTGEKLSRLLEMDAVAEVDLPPQPFFDAYSAATVTPRDFPSPPRPAPDGPRVCILDSGITSSHKLLANNIGHEEAILTDTTSPADANGHGTMVGGLAVFGDIRACYTAGRFSSPITLFSARVTNDASRFDDDKRIINQMRQAVEVFLAEPYNCKVFNISLGCPEPLLSDGNRRQGEWAQALDVVARDLKVLLVVSAGNHDASIATLTHDAEKALIGYPHYLFEPAAGLCDPATAAIPITVGALAEHDEPAVRKGSDKDDLVRPIAQAGQPTPSTRIGPGLNDAIKPEFVAYGGNSTFHGSGPIRSTKRIDPGVAVMSFSHRPVLDQLFAYHVGTSFAAIRVARLAALVWHRIRQDFGQDPDPNLVRAVLATATVMPEEACSLIEQTKGTDFIPRVCGYGMVDAELALESSDRRVTLVAQGSITIDTFHIFQVPVPEEFQDDSKSKRIVVALAYDPPVRRRRTQYLGVDMCCSLFRNKSVEEIVEAYRAITQEERKSKSLPGAIQDSSKCKLAPGVKALGTSTLQRCEWTSKTRLKDSDTFHLLVRADRNWAPSEITEQDFGVAVTLESNNPLLYGVIRERIPVRQRTRLRQ
jgi:subtilisin family serine protease